ncbi:MAG: TonB family protein [Steroidobacteraceae bacterium]
MTDAVLLGEAREGLAPVRDRLISMLLLAALVHGIVILGVTFGTLAGSQDSAPAIEVLLVGDEVPEAQRNDDAAYVAQRTQLGSGNTQEVVAAQLPRLRPAGDSGTASPAPQATARGETAPRTQLAGDGLLATWGPASQVTYLAPPEIAPEPELPLLLGDPDASAGAGKDAALQLRGKQRDELYVTADTRESLLAPYLDSWKQRVEKIGTVNYPSAAQRMGLRGSPVVEVAIKADGALLAASIRRSSGHAEIDAAALQILHLASPFNPFPPDLSAKYATLRFAYEWQFVGGHLARGTVSVP